MNRWLIACLALGVFCAGAMSQTPAPDVHQHPQPETIDGKDHPEMIPDLPAYGLFLTAVARSAAPTNEERQSQAVHLSMIHLSGQDNLAAISILASFHEKRQNLIRGYNTKAEAANKQGRDVDPAVRQAFFADLKSLVQTTHDTLQSTLSPEGWSAWDAHVQSEKRRMTIPAEGGVK